LLEQTGLAQTVVSDKESKKANVDSSTVSYKNGNVNLSGYLSKPMKKGKYPAILVIHENRGLNEHTRDVARRFAAAGYVALAADALSRKGGTGGVCHARKSARSVFVASRDRSNERFKRRTRIFERARKRQKRQTRLNRFCWGGARSFKLATEPNDLKAAVVFYGTAPTEEQLAKVHCPVLGIYGETDERITSKVPEVAAAMKKLKKNTNTKSTKARRTLFSTTPTPNATTPKPPKTLGRKRWHF
jgi:carboxymethylenebutenolidase